MTNQNPYTTDFRIDILTEPISRRISGESLKTQISLITKSDLKLITKSKGWLFNWRFEYNQIDREVYKLTILDSPGEIQGLMSLAFRTDHIYIYLLESANFNIGKNKIYQDVPENLVAFACNLSFKRGGEGFVSFTSKTELVGHYIHTLGAYHFGGRLMIIDDAAARKLVTKYIEI